MTHEMQVDVSKPQDMTLTRVFDAPRQLVWACWTDPAHMANWWGPMGFSNNCELDVRPGGKHNIVMIAPNGAEYPMMATYTELVEGEKIVVAIASECLPGTKVPQEITMTVTFEDLNDNQTRLTVTQSFANEALRDANMARGAKAGWDESFTKLDTLLDQLSQ